MTVILK